MAVNRNIINKILCFAPWASIIAGLLIAVLILSAFHIQDKALKDQMHTQALTELAYIENQVENYLLNLRTILRAISLDDEVVAMTRESHDYIQAIYDDTYERLLLSEIYVIDRDFDGTRRPFMTFERGDAEHTAEKIHVLENEEFEYRIQVEQIARFARNPELEIQISSVGKLCVDKIGVVFSVPIRSLDRLMGMVSAMLPSENISRLLELAVPHEMALLVNEQQDLFVCDDMPEHLQNWFLEEFREKGVNSFFQQQGKKFKTGVYDAWVKNINIPDGQKWYLTFLQDDSIHIAAQGRLGVFARYGIAIVVFVLGLSVAFLCAGLRKLLSAKDSLKQAKEQTDALNVQLTETTVIAQDMAKQADAANITKSRFLANMSHEIRTPMNAIMGFSDIMAQGELTAEQKEYTDMIQNAARSLLRLIDDVLDFSIIEAGKLDVKLSDCSLIKLLKSIDSMMRPPAVNKGLHFEIISDEKLPAIIKNDYDRVLQSLVNLVGNAVKFTEQGHVHLKVSLHQLDTESFIRFDVEDTGIGIDAEQQVKIFESFTQADESTSRKYGGAGLGLAITTQLAGLLGGELTLTSEKGKGSVFSLMIPAGLDVTKQPLMDGYDVANHTNISREKVEEPEFSGHVLVAEDVETNQMLIKSLLTRMGLEVTVVPDGNQTLHKALTNKYDLILMDIQMPHMNGYEATKAIRKEGITTPIVALTAYAMKSDETKCIEAGCDDYLAKPIDRRELWKLIAKYLPPKNETLDKTIDSAKSQVDEITKLCLNKTSLDSRSVEIACTDAGEEIINWDRLIDRLGDEEMIEEIVPIFLKDNSERLKTLTEMIKANNAEKIRFYAHAIKGAAKNIGAKRLSDIAYQLEGIGKENDVDAARPIFEKLKMELEKVLAFLSRPDWIEIAKNQKADSKGRFDDDVI